MYKLLGVVGEGAIAFGRRPEVLYEDDTAIGLASNATSPYKFAYARTALKYGLQSVGFKQGDVLLIPDLICESLLEPLDELGIVVQYYSVGQTLEPDWNRLEKILTKSTKALLIVHYFGQPQPISDCIEFCRKHSLMLIEDNAHGFGGTYEGQMLGTFGEIGISAPRKSFPIRNGAFLYTASSSGMELSAIQLQLSITINLKQRYKRLLKKIPTVKMFLKYRRRTDEYRRRLATRPSYESQDAFREPPLSNDYGMFESSRLFLVRQDIKQIRNVRRQVYHFWQEWAVTQGLTPVFPALYPGAIPLVFPAYTESATDSLLWYERGHRAGVDIHSWPTLPRAIVERNGSAMRIWERMLCFPIHQEMDVRLLKRRLAVL